jgi:hypothetical protein
VDAPPTKVTLTRPGRPGTHLVVMPGWVEGTWHTAEYRPATGWDAGLDTFGFAGVVVHTIKDNGAGQVVNYDSVIAVPGADLDWSNILFSLRVLDADADTVTVLVGRALPDMAPVVTVDVSQSATVLSLPGPSRTFKVGPRCEPREFPTFVEERHVTVTATAQSAGFDRPRFRFDVNGVPLGSWLPRTGDVNGTFDIPVTLSRPAQPDGATVGPATIRATVSARRNVVILTLPSGDGTYDLTVTAHATDDGPAELVAASETITVTTLGVTVPPEVYPQMTECVLAGLLEENLRWPPDPDEHPDWEQELEMLARATINPQLRDPIVPAGVIEFARRLRLPVGDVDRVVRQARRQPNP